MMAKAEAAGPTPEAGDVEEDDETTPWHFKLLVLALVLYLGYRAYQLIDWLVGRLF